MDKKKASGGPVDPDVVYRLGKNEDDHFGERLIKAIKALPEDMKNDPAYADPVAWVKRARENTDPPDSMANDTPVFEPFGDLSRLEYGFFQLPQNDTPEIIRGGRRYPLTQRGPDVPPGAIGIGYVMSSEDNPRLLEVSITDPVYAAKLRDSMSAGGQWGMSIGFKTDKPPQVVKQNAIEILFSNARALVRRLFKR